MERPSSSGGPREVGLLLPRLVSHRGPARAGLLGAAKLVVGFRIWILDLKLWCCLLRGAFFFFIFKKIKISKIYVRFEKFQKYTPVALWGATGPKYNFFLQICNEVSGRGRAGAGGPVAPPPSGDRPYISSLPPFPPHLSPKIPLKIQEKKRGTSTKNPEKKRWVRKRKAAKPCRITHL